MSRRLPALLEKAALDAGYDLLLAHGDDWTCAGVSGQVAQVLIKPSEPGALLAVKDPNLLERLGLLAAAGPAPGDYKSVAMVEGPASLHVVLRKLHVLQVRPAARLTAELEARLAAIPETERTQEVRKRIGQDVFREALFELWNGRCALSGVGFPPSLLRASHAKPWAVASSDERLDPFNGLLLAVHYDALFDKGLISFADNGQLLIRPDLAAEVRKALALEATMRVEGILPGHLPYLSHHRMHVAQVDLWR